MRHLRPAAGGGAQGFFVGDEFQSIYRFRHSDVAVFVERREQAPTVLDLRGNFRSRPEVLAVVNRVFGETFGSGYRALVPRGSFEGAGFEQFAELLVAEGGTSEQRRTAEAALLARRIQALVETSDHLDYGDVVILLRAATDVHLYEQELEALGIRTHSVIGRGYYGRQQVLDLCAYLALLRNRYDDRALATVLASPLVGVCNDALFRLRREGEDSPLVRARGRAARGGCAADANLLRAFAQRFARLVARSRRARSRERCSSGSSATTTTTWPASRRPTGAAAMPTCARWSAWRATTSRCAGRTSAGFLRFVEAQDAGWARAPDTALANEESDAVRLMTIHAAKGLEFPVCVVADCGRQSGFAAARCDRAPRRARRPAGAGRDRTAAPLARVRGGASPPSRTPTPTSCGACCTWPRRAPSTASCSRARVAGPARPWMCSPTGSASIWTRSIAGAPVLHDLADSGGVLVQRVVVEQEAGEESPPADGDDRAGAAHPAGHDRGTCAGGRGRDRCASAARAAARSRRSHVPRELSFTALSLHERCGYRYYSERVLGPAAHGHARRRRGRRGVAPDGDGRRLGGALALELEDADVVVASDYAHAGEADRELIRGFVAELGRRAELRGRIAERSGRARGVVRVRARRHRLARLPRPAARGPTGRSSSSTTRPTRSPSASRTRSWRTTTRCSRSTYALAGLREAAPEVEVCFAFLDRAGAIVCADVRPGRSRMHSSGEIAAAIERLAQLRLRAATVAVHCAGCGALDRICAGPRLERFG